MLSYILVGIFAGAGAISRFVLDTRINEKKTISIPYATWCINTLACFLGGFVSGLVKHHLFSGSIDPFLMTYITTGFLGGFSTFSTAMVELARLAQDRRYGSLAILMLGMLASCTLAYIVGYKLIVW